MNYELAKKLKDVGIPQENRVEYYFGTEEEFEKGKGFGRSFYSDLPSWGVTVAVPTLAELIEACDQEGSRFCSLQKIDEKWRATGFHNDKDVYGDATSSSPEEAVAHLWLALNKK